MWYDYLVLAILAYTTIRGAMKGIVWQLAAIGALIACFAFAEPLSLSVAPYISVDPPLNRWIAMLAIYLVFGFVTFAIARRLRSLIEKFRFVEYDRHMGAIFGFVKGVVICLVLTFFVVTLSASMRKDVLGSYSGHVAALIMDRLHPVMPKELHDVLEPYIHQLDRPGIDLQHAHDSDENQTDHKASDDGHTAVSANKSQTLNDFVSNLPGVFDDEVRNLVKQSLEHTQPEDRPELMEKLRSGVPGLIRLIAQQWQNGKPAVVDGGEEAQQRQQLFREIGAVYAELPEAQDTIVEEIELALTGVPDGVVLSLLEDWHSDLLATDPDPDIETNALTTLDVRILRQLAKARISISSLEGNLQNRLKKSLPR